MKQVMYRVPRGATLLVAILLLSVLGASVPVVQTAPQESLAGLEGVFSVGAILQDRNGDEVVDFVEAAIVLGEAPTPQEVDCTQTHLAKAGVLIRHRGDSPSFDLMVRRSFADYVATWLKDAAEEYGVAVISQPTDSAAVPASDAPPRGLKSAT